MIICNRIIYNLNLDHSISAPVEQYICSRANNTSFVTATHRTIIIVIPFSVIFGISSIMTSTQTSIMIAHCVQVIYRFSTICYRIISLIFGRNQDFFDFWFIVITTNRFWVYDIILKVKYWRKVDLSLIFFFTNNSFLLEPFKV